MTPRTWTLAFPTATAPLSSNRRIHWRQRARETRWWLSATEILIREARIPALDRVDIELVMTPPNNRRRDSDNYVAYVLKPIKDGLVTVGVVPDDTDRYIAWRLRFDPARPNPMSRWEYRLHVRELEALAA